MKHLASSRFWLLFAVLTVEVQELAQRNYSLLRQGSSHSSLHYKSVKNGPYRSVRVGLYYRALGLPVPGDIVVWIGSYAEYDRLIA